MANLPPIPLTTQLRLRYGMFWSGKYPPLTRVRHLVFSLLLLFLLLYLGWVKVELNFISQAYATIQDKRSDEGQLIADVLNGKPVLYYPNNSGKGYGRTYIMCDSYEMKI